MADGREQRGAHPVGGRDRLGRLGLGGQPLLIERDGRVGGERAEHAPVRGRQRPAAERQREGIGDRHLDIRLVRPGDGGFTAAGDDVPAAGRAPDPARGGVGGLLAVG